jgi:head-tail adaptor
VAGSGYWRTRYILQVPTTTVDGAGQGAVSWLNAVSGLAGVVTPSQREVLNDMGVTVRTDVVIEMAWHPSVASKCRLIEAGSGMVWNITGVVDPDGGKRRRLRVTASNMDGETA